MSKKNKLFIVNFNQILVICIVNLFVFIIITILDLSKEEIKMIIYNYLSKQ